MDRMSASGTHDQIGPGLRERKKLRTRLTIQHHALRLFAEQGYDQTTVEQIAAAADVSPSTFFRYYPTKDDVVMTDHYDPLFAEAVAARPAAETPLEALHGAMLGLLPEMLADGGEDMRARLRLVLAEPSLRGRIIQNTMDSVTVMAGGLARREGRDEPSIEDQAVTAAYIGVAVVALLRWAGHGGDPAALIERGLTALRANLPATGDSPADGGTNADGPAAGAPR